MIFFSNICTKYIKSYKLYIHTHANKNHNLIFCHCNRKKVIKRCVTKFKKKKHLYYQPLHTRVKNIKCIKRNILFICLSTLFYDWWEHSSFYPVPSLLVLLFITFRDTISISKERKFDLFRFVFWFPAHTLTHTQ